ncbi:helix-turn-helix domain-containing protein [Pinirhizobacter soli]|uniref:helix-turn-helix domain-containing protein n=1 Tax=Pinirhizobacter soli TaxID=2786953 RepID=UPI00202A4C3B|nr:helix-turn-helix domain-containing protein [Pinirhizobacter soli]
MGFLRITPPPPLAALVEAIWDWDLPAPGHAFDRILPLPTASLIINLAQDETRLYASEDAPCTRLPGSVISGPFTGSFVIDTAEQVRVMGVNFRPGGAWPLFGTDLDALADRDTPLDAVAGPTAVALRERLLHEPSPAVRVALVQSWLESRLGRVQLDAAVLAATGMLDLDPAWARISDIVRATGLSSQRLGLLFRRQVGLTPKRYARLRRFHGVIDAIGIERPFEWANVAVDGGYADQAHLVHEFRHFAGMTPGEYLRRRGPHSRHVPLD